MSGDAAPVSGAVPASVGTPASGAAALGDGPSGGEKPLRVAYVMSRFPKLTETFVLFEMIAVERAGVDIALYPLLREREPIVHPEALPWVARAHYLPFLSLAIMGSQLAFLREAPVTYLRALGAVVRGCWRSPNLLLGGLGIFPKVAHAARLMRAEGVRHVHCHFATHPALAGFLVHRLVGIPFSFTGHGSDLHVDRTMLCEKVHEAAFAVTISQDNRRLIETECGGPIPTLHVLHCGVDTNVFRPVERDPAAPGAALHLLAVGTLHEVKGQAFLIEAVRILREQGRAVTCRFVGDGPDRAALERQVADGGLESAVEFLGQRTRAEIASLLASSDVLVAPSVPTRRGKREGIPVVLMEAMSAGLPPVASALSGIPELVEDGVSGLTVPPRDPVALAAAIARLQDDPELRARLGEGARATVLEGFDVERNARLLVERFREAAA